jgi:hypothetical protein
VWHRWGLDPRGYCCRIAHVKRLAVRLMIRRSGIHLVCTPACSIKGPIADEPDYNQHSFITSSRRPRRVEADWKLLIPPCVLYHTLISWKNLNRHTVGRTIRCLIRIYRPCRNFWHILWSSEGNTLLGKQYGFIDFTSQFISSWSKFCCTKLWARARQGNCIKVYCMEHCLVICM